MSSDVKVCESESPAGARKPARSHPEFLNQCMCWLCCVNLTRLSYVPRLPSYAGTSLCCTSLYCTSQTLQFFTMKQTLHQQKDSNSLDYSTHLIVMVGTRTCTVAEVSLYVSVEWAAKHRLVRAGERKEAVATLYCFPVTASHVNLSAALKGFYRCKVVISGF